MRPARRHDVFDAVAHPVRRQILVLLKDGSRPAGALAEPFRMSLAAVSQHLRVLREAEVVTEERRGRQILYSINPQPLRAVHEWIDGFGDFWNDRLDALERHLDRKHGAKPTR
jgi:DNA-binding transcriptional ArsR family regulator